MLTRRSIFLVFCWVLLLPGISLGVVRPAWQLELKESTTVNGGIARLSDLAKGPLPAGLGKVVIVSGGQPGSVKAISHRMILRKLVTDGLAGGVSFKGSKWSNVTFAGAESPVEGLRLQIRALIQPKVPSGKQGAPSSWFDLNLPEISFAFQHEIKVSCLNSKTLVPGRNNLRMRAYDGATHQDFQVIVNLHVSGEIGTALNPISKESSLNVADFQWEWRDLAEIGHGLVTCREALLACSATTNIKPGHILRQTDIKNTPVILAGDSVDLCITRGSLEVVVKGVARQAGGLGQVIPVRNSLNGQLVNATVSGQGIVQWRN